MSFEIIDDNGTIYSSQYKEEMEYAFSAMLEIEEDFENTEEFKKAKNKYNYEWEGDLKLVEVLKIERDNCHENIDLATFVNSMIPYTWHHNNASKIGMIRPDNKEFNKEWLERITPEFQKDNEEWDTTMKTNFIEDLLSGKKVELMFFRFDAYEDAQIIDGLQKVTAILDFFNGKIKPFGDSYFDLRNESKYLKNKDLSIKLYTLESWKEVGQFYIDINKGITHSKKDIQKAKDWFLAEHNIKL